MFVFGLFWLSCYLFCFVLFLFCLFVCFCFVLFCCLFVLLFCFVFVSFCFGGCLCVFSFLTLENGSTLKSLITYTGVGLGFVCLFVCLFVSSPFNLVNVFCVCGGVCLFLFCFCFVLLFRLFVLSAIKTNNVWVLYLVMTGLSLPLQLWSQNLLLMLWLFY